MAGNESKHRADRLKRELKNAQRQTGTRSTRSRAGGSVRTSNLNIARRTNIVVARNLGRDDAVESAAAKQTVRIRQTPVGTQEASEATSRGAWKEESRK
jgi:hypothetical protein